jgi:predicted DNA-binding transcriptional regulator YafY
MDGSVFYVLCQGQEYEKPDNTTHEARCYYIVLFWENDNSLGGWCRLWNRFRRRWSIHRIVVLHIHEAQLQVHFLAQDTVKL